MGLITMLEELARICEQQANALKEAAIKLQEYNQLQEAKSKLLEELNKKFEEELG